ncbi:MAG: adenosylcobinamide-GDP ribazoletransferase [Bacillota bacterium]
MHLLLALQLLTIFPVRMGAAKDPAAYGRSARYFPLVGLFLGLIVGGLNLAANKFMHPFPADALAVFCLILLSGGLHMDGLMDTADGLFSGRGRERALEIMRDSRVGAMGVIAFGSVLMLKVALLGGIDPAFKIKALILAPVLGRWTMTISAARFPYARKEPGLGQTYTEYVRWKEVLVASLITLAAAYLMIGWSGLVLAGVVFIASQAVSSWMARRVGGMTGDTFGALNEMMEVTALFVLAVVSRDNIFGGIGL